MSDLSDGDDTLATPGCQSSEINHAKNTFGSEFSDSLLFSYPQNSCVLGLKARGNLERCASWTVLCSSPPVPDILCVGLFARLLEFPAKHQGSAVPKNEEKPPENKSKSLCV